MRCNFQIEGSGPRPEDVLLDAGKGYANPDLPGAKPGGTAGCDNPDDCYTKHVVLRADRADGFVAKNLLTRGGREFGIYTEEIDGYLLARTKFFWNADYGQLSFTSDHGLMQQLRRLRLRRLGRLPGRRPGDGLAGRHSRSIPTPPGTTPPSRSATCTARRWATRGRWATPCGSPENHIYGNITGIASDTLSSAGHPGFPADYSQIDHNLIYSNNLDLYVDNPPVEPLVPVPLGTGIIYAGMNDARVHDNHIFDNWRVRVDAVRGSRRASPRAAAPRAGSTRASPVRARPRTASPPRAGTSSSTTSWAGRPPGSSSRRRWTSSAPTTRPGAGPLSERTRLLVGRVLRQHRKLLVRQHRSRRDRGQRHRAGGGLAAGRAALQLRHQRRWRRRRQDAVPDRVLERPRQRHRSDRLRLVAPGAPA